MAIVYLQLQNVSKAFGDEEILNDISLQVREGECFGLIGPNGAGKSTLFRIIIGEETADRGEVVVPRGVRVGYLTQDAEVTRRAARCAPNCLPRAKISRASPRACTSWKRRWLRLMRTTRPWSSTAGCMSTRTWSEEFHRLGGDTLEADALRMLRGLGLGEEFDAARSLRSPAGKNGGWHWPSCCSPIRICCCSMSRPTTWISPR